MSFVIIVNELTSFTIWLFRKDPVKRSQHFGAIYRNIVATFVDVACCGRLARFLARILHPGMRTNLICNIQHVATGWPNARNMLRPAMLGYIVPTFCDRLVGACKFWTNNVAICCVDMLRSLGRSLRGNPLCAMVFVHLNGELQRVSNDIRSEALFYG